jgi:hypothetical protein
VVRTHVQGVREVRQHGGAGDGLGVQQVVSGAVSDIVRQ